jgi:flagellar protein FliO/FliZ
MPYLLQVLLALATVLALIVGASWLLQKVRTQGGQGRALIHVEASVSIGSRERIVLVEVAGQWLLLGVATGQVSTLLQLNSSPLTTEPNNEQAQFSKSWLKKYMGKVHAA